MKRSLQLRFCRVTLVMAATLLVSLGLPGCRSTEPTTVDSPAPMKKAFVAPEWDSTEFRHEDGVFFVHYPSDFQEQPPQGPGAVLSVASPSMVPRVDVTTIPNIGDASIDQVAEQLEANLAQVGGGEATVTTMEMVKLRDGVTDAMKFLADWSFQGFPLNSVVLVAPAADYHVNVMVTGMDGGDQEQLEDIAFTLTLP